MDAALATLLWSDQNLRVDLAAFVHNHVASLIEEEIAAGSNTALLCRAVYHSSFADTVIGAECARELFRRARREGGAVGSDLMRKSGACLWRSGEAYEAIDAYEAAFAEAEKCGSQRTAFALAMMLNASYDDVGDVARSAFWLDRVDELSTSESAGSLEFFYAIVLAERALAKESIADLREVDKRFWHSSFRSHARGRRWHHAIERYLKVADQVPIEWDEEIVRAFEILTPGAELGDLSDLDVASLAHGLISVGHRDRAVEVVRRYLNFYRRGNTPLSRLLRRSVSVLRIVEVPKWIATSHQSASEATVQASEVQGLSDLCRSP